MNKKMVFLKRLLNIQNIPTILAVIGSILLVILQIPGLLTQDQLLAGIILIIGLVAISQLVEKVDKLSNIEDLVRETSILIREQTSAIESGLTLIQGHDSVEQNYVYLIQNSKERLIAFALGVDLDSEFWKIQIQPYLAATESALARGVHYQRLQVLEPAPIAWLKFIHKLLSNPEYKQNVDIRFIELPADYYYHRVFQLFIVDESEASLVVNVETGATDTEFAVCIKHQSTAKELADHFLKTSWSRSVKYSADELNILIQEKIKQRSQQIRDRVGDFLIELLKKDEKLLGLGTSLSDFQKVASPAASDEELLKYHQSQTILLWNNITALGNKQEKIKAVKNWVSHGDVFTP